MQIPRRPPFFWLALGALLVLGLAIRSWLSFDSRSDEPASSAMTSMVSGAEETEEGSLPPVVRKPVATPRHRVADRSEPPPEAPSMPLAEDTVEVEGTVVVTDPDGREHATEDGWFDLHFWNDFDRKKCCPTVHIKGGRWTARLRRDTPYGIEDLRLAYEVAVVTNEGPIGVPEQGLVAIKARWVPSTVLRVLDAETGNDLAGVTVIELEWTKPFGLRNSRAIASETTSPIVLRERKRGVGWPTGWGKLWVHAPLHAWTPAEVDVVRGGEYRVWLPGAAQLEVIVNDAQHLLQSHVDGEASGLPSDVKPRLHLRQLDFDLLVADAVARLASREEATRPDEREIRRRLEDSWDSYSNLGVLPDDHMVFELATGPSTMLNDVMPGHYALTLEEAPRGKILTRTTVQLVAGQHTQAVLEVKAAPEPEAVPLSGTLFVHPDWHVREVNVTFQGPGRMKIVWFNQMQQLGEPGLFAWDAGLVIPGDYIATLSGVGRNVSFEVGPGGRQDVALVVAEPVTVKVESSTSRMARRGVLDP